MQFVITIVLSGLMLGAETEKDLPEFYTQSPSADQSHLVSYEAAQATLEAFNAVYPPDLTAQSIISALSKQITAHPILPKTPEGQGVLGNVLYNACPHHILRNITGVSCTYGWEQKNTSGYALPADTLWSGDNIFTHTFSFTINREERTIFTLQRQGECYAIERYMRIPYLMAYIHAQRSNSTPSADITARLALTTILCYNVPWFGDCVAQTLSDIWRTANKPLLAHNLRCNDPLI